MGNDNQKYFTNNDALEIIGGETWTAVKSKFEKYGSRYVEFQVFYNIIHHRFEKMPKQLISSLYNAFAPNENERVEVETFIACLAVLGQSDDRTATSRFLFRVYQTPNLLPPTVEQNRLVDVLRFAHSPQDYAKRSAALQVQLDQMFATSESLNMKEFETHFLYNKGKFNIFAEWIYRVLLVFTEPSPTPRLSLLEKRYSSVFDSDEMRAKYDLDKATAEQLRQMFYAHCGTGSGGGNNGSGKVVTQFVSNRADLALFSWLAWVVDTRYLSSLLATVMFVAKKVQYRDTWRFVDLVEFCMDHAAGSIEHRINTVCTAFVLYGNTTSEGVRVRKKSDRSRVHLSLRGMVYALSESVDQSRLGDHGQAGSGGVASTADPTAKTDAADKTTLSPILSVAMDTAAASSNNRDEVLVLAFKQLLMEHVALLPGLRDLSLTACCLMGVQPTSPLLEKEYITELTLRYMSRVGVSGLHTHGVPGSEWCLVTKSWYDSWRVFVGHSGSDNGRSLSSKGSARIHPNGSVMSPTSGSVRASPQRRPPPKPAAIDNWSILRKYGARGQLLQGISDGHDFCIVAPNVYSALYAWYGGGPRIVRKVISSQGVTQLELFPLSIKVVTCDAQGRTNNLSAQESLFSKTLTVREMIDELCVGKSHVRSDQVRLWNYALTTWQEQTVLSPEVTLMEANIQDGQSVLMEISLPNGTWPRSQLHANMEAERRREEGLSSPAADDPASSSSTTTSSDLATPTLSTTPSPLTLNRKHQLAIRQQTQKRRQGRGLVGLENLGNTCYLNSSLQALLHIDQLVDYFLSQSYLRDINVKNMHGFKGKLATSFGRLVSDLYGAENRSAISPRQLFSTIATLRDQFAGNEQHDAQELLAFLLDGLSEDLNLVHHKPYIQQPDSDDRPDAELADIWWRNHMLRDHSIIQSLFTGQFQSIMSCSCGYSSARYEPFTCLTVPIPEPTHRVMTVLVIPLNISHVTRVAVSIKKTGCLEDVLLKVKELTFESFKLDESSLFLAGELVRDRMTKFNSFDRELSAFSDGEVLALYQVAKLPGFFGDHAVVEVVESDAAAAVLEEDESSSESEDDLLGSANTTTSNNRSSRLLNGVSNSNMSGDVMIRGAARYRESHWIRVALIQRVARLVEGNLLGSAGYDAFLPEVMGLTVLEVLPADVLASDLYSLIAARVAPLLKGSVSSLLQRNSITADMTNDPTAVPSHVSAVTPSSIYPISSDEVFGSAVIPPTGFTLRLITKGHACSRCHWLERCQGCAVPNSPLVKMTLSDGECLAIDWHFVVVEELLDATSVVSVVDHVSVSTESESSSEALRVPLSRCLDKFTEKEPLEDVVCPRCKNAEHGSVMSKSLTVWRQPPILMVQIKRFQFDRTARRKLTQRVDFPLEGLDLKGHMSRARFVSGDSVAISNAVKASLTLKVTPSTESGCVEDQRPGAYSSSSQSTPLTPKLSLADDDSIRSAELKSLALGDVSLEAEGGQEEVVNRLAASSDLNSSQIDIIVPDVIMPGDGDVNVLPVVPPQKERAADIHDAEAKSVPPKSVSSSHTLAPSTCTEYDLCSAIHHLGLLNGGHYVTAVRERHQQQSHPAFSGADSSPQSPAAAPSATDKWLVLNDHLITGLSDSSDVSSASAYVLFYVRRDVQGVDFSQLLMEEEGADGSPPADESLPGDRDGGMHGKKMSQSREDVAASSSSSAGRLVGPPLGGKRRFFSGTPQPTFSQSQPDIINNITSGTEALIRAVTHKQPFSSVNTSDGGVKSPSYAQAATKAIDPIGSDLISSPIGDPLPVSKVHPRMMQPQHKHVPVTTRKKDDEGCIVG